MSSEPANFVIRNIDRRKKGERVRVLDFLTDNQDSGIRLREKSEMERAFRTGYGLVTDRQASVACSSLIYGYTEKARRLRGEEPAELFYEIGTQRSVAAGFGLQVFSTSLHLFQIQRQEDWSENSGGITVFAVVAPGTPSARNHLELNLLQPWSPPAILQQLRRECGVAFDPEKQVLVARAQAFEQATVILKDLYLGEGRFRTPKGEGFIYWPNYINFIDDDQFE